MGDSFSHQNRVALRHGGGARGGGGPRNATETASLYPSANFPTSNQREPPTTVDIDALARRPSRPSSPVQDTGGGGRLSRPDSRIMEQNPRHSSLCSDSL